MIDRRTVLVALMGAAGASRVMRGAKPANIPVEDPPRLELVLNLKTAKALGIAFPDAIRLRADRVIE